MNTFHVCAYEEAIDNTANADLDAIADNIIQQQNSHFIHASPLQIGFVWIGSANLLRARLVTPRYRQVTTPFIVPIEGAVLPADDPNVADWSDRRLLLPAEEELAIEATSGVACGTEQCVAVVGLYKEPKPAPTGDIYTLRGTSTTAAVARTWTEVTVTWQDQLQSGLYAVVGGKYVATNAIAFRTIFQDQTFRPGALGYAAETTSPWKRQLRGGLGEWGRFRAERRPIIEVLNNGTDSAHTFYLDLVKVG